MSDGMSDGRNYGPSLSKHGPPLVSRDGRPVKCNACGVEGVHPIEICLSMVRSELEVAKLQVADLRKFVERIVTDYGCPYSAQGEFDCAEGKCSACDGYRMVDLKPKDHLMGKHTSAYSTCPRCKQMDEERENFSEKQDGQNA